MSFKIKNCFVVIGSVSSYYDDISLPIERCDFFDIQQY